MLRVPEEIVEVLENIEREVLPEHILNALKWAAKNPEKAKRVAEGFRKLSPLGKKEFEYYIRLGYNPEDALESAEERQTEAHKRRSTLGKILAGARRGGYRLKMPNGVECIVKHDGNHYKFTFNPGGAEVTLIRESGRHLSYILAELSEGRVSQYWFGVVIYKERAYNSRSRQAETVLKAIEENVSPEVLAAPTFKCLKVLRRK